MPVEVVVAFDDEYADVVTTQTYLGVVDKYDACAIGHSDGTTSLFVDVDTNLGELEEGLGEIPIRAVHAYGLPLFPDYVFSYCPD